MIKVVKRDCSEVNFDKSKISTAILKAMKNGSGIVKPKIAEDIANEIEEACRDKDEVSVYDIESIVFDKLITKKQRLTAKAYEGYRSKREFQRDCVNSTDKDVQELLSGESDYWAHENANKNPRLGTTQRDYMAGIVSTDLTRRYLLPPEIVQAHDEGIIHFHDADYFGQNALHNCDLVNLEDMLQNNTVISDTLIETPHTFSTACNIGTQAVAQIASSQYGGQSISLAHLAPFVQVSREKIRKDVIRELSLLKTKDEIPQDTIDKIVKGRLQEEITRGIQMIQYQLITIQTTNGQAPFLTIFMYLNEAKNEKEKEDLAWLIEEMIKQRIQGVKNEQGVFIAPAFPKLIYVLEEDNIHEESKYFYLTKLTAECSTKRLVPDYISEKKMKELKNENVYTCMGCRSFLTVDRFSKTKGNISNAKNFEEHKGHIYYGRFNQGVVTISLPDVAFSSDGDEEVFWQLMEERTELCHKALRCRHERLLGTPSDIAPILWQHGALARLKKGETIDKLLYDGYSTISLGYTGLYECVKFMTGHSHTDGGIGEKFALKVMQKLNDKCNQWKDAENIDYSIYGTPQESGTYKFAKCLKKRFGEDIFIKLDGFDRNYVTNSYHVPVFEHITWDEKLRIESKFQALSPGGAISYIEIPDMKHNVDAIVSVLQYIYETIMYAELNTKSCYCEKCGFDGRIELVNKDGIYVWECPNCGNTDANTMDIAFRTCGYIGTAKNGGNQGRYGDIHDRVYHLDDMEYVEE